MLVCTPHASWNSWIHNLDWYMAWPDTGIVTPTRFHSELARPTMMITSISTPCGYPLCTVHPAKGLDRSTGKREMESCDDINGHDVVGSFRYLTCCRKVYSLPTSRRLPDLFFIIPIHYTNLKSLEKFLNLCSYSCSLNLYITPNFTSIYTTVHYTYLADTTFTTSLCQELRL